MSISRFETQFPELRAEKAADVQAAVRVVVNECLQEAKGLDLDKTIG